MIVWVLEDYRKNDWKLRHDKAFTSVSVGKNEQPERKEYSDGESNSEEDSGEAIIPPLKPKPVLPKSKIKKFQKSVFSKRLRKKGEAAVKAEAKAEEETEKAYVASKHDPVTIIETSSLMPLVKRFWI